MPRVKSPKADNLTNARDALKVAMLAYSDGVADLLKAIEAKDHKAATASYKQAHDYMLVSKDMLNLIYPHLAELRPKTEPKPARKDKRPSDAKAATEAAKARREERNDKKRGPQRENHATVERDEASSDEPSDPDSV